MKSFIVPIDFSDTSVNAARYAAQLAAEAGDVSLILYNTHEKILSGSDGTPLFNDSDARQQIAVVALESVKTELLGLADIPITCVAEGGDFVDSLETYVKSLRVEMIVMGITGSTPLEQILIGSNTLKVIQRNICPVLIIPPGARFTGIRNVVFASDFKDVEKTTPIVPIKQFLHLTRPTLHVANVDHEHYVELTEEYKKEKNKLEEMLAPYRPEFYFIRLYDFIDTISQFTFDNNIDVIITVPRKHSFLKGLFKQSNTRKLAYHSHVPILAVHEL
jgi:nucleotide-binding universal stress UspA family protein